ncbi:MAG: hypothetical protein QOH10_526 [Actinomycetota bacterium]|nr:hypothetical protein [Actinomycetota bacterium]
MSHKWQGVRGLVGENPAVELATSDLMKAADWAAERWAAFPAQRWDATDTTVEWTPRRTLDHLVDAMLLYSAYVATRARERVSPPRNGDPSSAPGALMDAFRSGIVILTRLLDGFRDDERAYHPSGMADRSGWIGMACTEILVHTEDATGGGDTPAEPFPVALADAVVDRVLPWAPRDGNGWERLFWATGRASLGGRPPEPSDWWWQSAPLAEWDGKPCRRTSPPQW